MFPMIWLVCTGKDATLCAPIHRGGVSGTDSTLNSKLCSSTASKTSERLKFRYVVTPSPKQGYEILSLFGVVWGPTTNPGEMEKRKWMMG